MKKIPDVSVPDAPHWFNSVYSAYSEHPDFPHPRYIRYVVKTLMREEVLLPHMTSRAAIMAVGKHYKRVLG